jgi:hypothetical protein
LPKFGSNPIRKIYEDSLIPISRCSNESLIILRDDVEAILREAKRLVEQTGKGL